MIFGLDLQVKEFRLMIGKSAKSYLVILTDRSCETPVVVVVVEGGFFTLRQVSDYLNDEPPIPVVIFAGTGRSADLMAWALRKLGSDEDFELMKDKIYHKIMKLFHIGHSQCSVLYQELRSIYAKKSLVKPDEIYLFLPETLKVHLKHNSRHNWHYLLKGVGVQPEFDNQRGRF